MIEYLVGYLCVIVFMLLLEMFGAMLFFILNVNIKCFSWYLFKTFSYYMRSLQPWTKIMRKTTNFTEK